VREQRRALSAPQPYRSRNMPQPSVGFRMVLEWKMTGRGMKWRKWGVLESVLGSVLDVEELLYPVYRDLPKYSLAFCS
jgi:hypothetical protein